MHTESGNEPSFLIITKLRWAWSPNLEGAMMEGSDVIFESHALLAALVAGSWAF